jgi:hypothetical protein
MATGTAREAVLQQISYALAVQTLVEQGAIQEPIITPGHKRTTNRAAEQLMDQFERMSFVDEVTKIARGPGYWYGWSQGLLSAFCYSIVLVIISLIVKYNGIDIIAALTKPAVK